MSTPLLGVPLPPRWPLEDGTLVRRAASNVHETFGAGGHRGGRMWGHDAVGVRFRPDRAARRGENRIRRRSDGIRLGDGIRGGDGIRRGIARFV